MGIAAFLAKFDQLSDQWKNGRPTKTTTKRDGEGLSTEKGYLTRMLGGRASHSSPCRATRPPAGRSGAGQDGAGPAVAKSAVVAAGPAASTRRR